VSRALLVALALLVPPDIQEIGEILDLLALQAPPVSRGLPDQPDVRGFLEIQASPVQLALLGTLGPAALKDLVVLLGIWATQALRESSD